MRVKAKSIKDICLRYARPEIQVMEVKVQGVLCGSNEPMTEYDFGDGGFGNDY